jgi:putative pyruvate formate lyase activating enzyme
VNRLNGETGYCASGAEPVVYSYAPHHGEEPPLSGWNGSGTIFFSRCNMGCVYCQNYKFSQFDTGEKVSAVELGNIMLRLQDMGCHNINFVSPTHFVPKIVEALKYAYSDGLELPVVYNTGGFDSVSVIRSLEGLMDIYLPDMRYSSEVNAEKYSDAPGYAANNRNLVKEMQRQVGDLEISDSVARKGLIVRLLILPGGISGTTETLEFIRENLGKSVYLSVMSQYYPVYRALSCKELACRIKREDYDTVIGKMRRLEFHSGWIQPLEGGFDERFAGENFLPT